MAAARANNLPKLLRYDIRPTLVEARLISDKHASDAAYLIGLSEQLLTIERKIAALEASLHLHPSSEAPQPTEAASNDSLPDINWIRTKSAQLGSRLRRIEEMPARTQ